MYLDSRAVSLKTLIALKTRPTFFNFLLARNFLKFSILMVPDLEFLSFSANQQCPKHSEELIRLSDFLLNKRDMKSFASGDTASNSS